MTNDPEALESESNIVHDADAPPLDDEALALIADELFREYDAREAADRSRGDESRPTDVDQETDPR